MLSPIFANFAQFSEIIKYKAITPQFYIIKYLEYDLICAIVQDWINPTNMIAFYAIHSKLTNIIRIYYKHCSDNGRKLEQKRKSEERAKRIRALVETIPQDIDILQLQSVIICHYHDLNDKSHLRPIPYYLLSNGFSIDLKQLFDRVNLKKIKKNNWKIRRYFAIFFAALVHYLNKHKIRTNKASKVFFNRRFNRHIAQFV
jgi:hypothetical protein